jgi:hypothetical protein
MPGSHGSTTPPGKPRRTSASLKASCRAFGVHICPQGGGVRPRQFDFSWSPGRARLHSEVKSSTLADDGVPCSPTPAQRAARHVKTSDAEREGVRTVVLFLSMRGAPAPSCPPHNRPRVRVRSRVGLEGGLRPLLLHADIPWICHSRRRLPWSHGARPVRTQDESREELENAPLDP